MDEDDNLQENQPDRRIKVGEKQQKNQRHFYHTFESFHKLCRLALLAREVCEQMKSFCVQNQETLANVSLTRASVLRTVPGAEWYSIKIYRMNKYSCG